MAIGRALIAAITRRGSAHERQYAPMGFDEVWSVTRAGDWVLFQASFRRGLEPAAFVLRATGESYEYSGQGYAGLSESEAMVRQQLASEVPEAPPELWACADLSRWAM